MKNPFVAYYIKRDPAAIGLAMHISLLFRLASHFNLINLSFNVTSNVLVCIADLFIINTF